MSITVKRISELEYLGKPDHSGYVEFTQGGKNYRVQLSALLQTFADYTKTTSTADSRPYWVGAPGHFVDTTVMTVTVDAGGKAYYNGAEHTLAGSPAIDIPGLTTVGVSRFDALLYDTQAGTFTLIVGSEAENPVTPAFNVMRYLLLGYLNITAKGVESQSQPSDHVQNSDQYLDYKGVHQISAKQIVEGLAARVEKSTTLDGTIKKFHNIASLDLRNTLGIGTIKITLPQSWTDTMMNISVQGYSYREGEGGWTAHIGGTNSVVGYWLYTSASVEGNAPFGNVRFGYDAAGKCCILLGNVNGEWLYPFLVIDSLTIDNSGTDLNWQDGWQIELITDETGITLRADAAKAVIKKSALWHKGNQGHGSGLDADMLDGFHAWDFYTANDIDTIWKQKHQLTEGSKAIAATGSWDNYTETGFYVGSNMLQEPPFSEGLSNYKYVQVIRYDIGSTVNVMQIATDFSGQETWFRTGDASRTPYFSAWKRQWHDGNFNPASYYTAAQIDAGWKQKHRLTHNNLAISDSYEGKGDWNLYVDTGFYMGSSLLNQPTSGNANIHHWKYVQVIRHNATWVVQIAWDFNGYEMWFRTLSSGTWTSWRRMWHDGNSTSASDRRLKENITPIESILDKISQINSYTFYWKDKSQGEGRELGVIAQEVEEVFPEVIQENVEGIKSVDYAKLSSVAFSGINELKKENNQLKNIIQQLAERIEALENK